ncbi:MAG TPA: hypothetical protein ENJ05_04395 [Thiotrichales bacterium]|nr:hypothetical protein [Thiotrichales bacterium]
MRVRSRKPDPMLLLAIAVGIGVVVTTVVQAEDDPLSRGVGFAGGSQWAGTFELDLRWREGGAMGRVLDDVVSKRRLDLVGGRHPRDTRLGLSADPPRKHLSASHNGLASDSFNSFNSNKSQTGVYLFITHPWD